MSNAYDIVMQSRQEIVDRLIAQMEKGYAATRAAWSKSATGRPYNPVSDAVYKGGNRFRLMIAAEAYGFLDPRWMTFKQAKEHGYKIAPGATGMLLEKWIFFKDVVKVDQNGKPILDVNGNPQFERVKLKKPVVNYFKVFNGEQVVGLPELPSKEITKDTYTDMADAFEKSSRCPVVYEQQDRAFYSLSMDTIYLPPKEAFKNNETRLSVLLHEMSHSTGHPDCLDRKINNAFGTEMYAREELNAELSAAFLEDELGISLEPDSEMIKDHANYIKNWIAALKDDPNELFRACAAAEEITDYLMGNYRAELEREKQELLAEEETQTQDAKKDPVADVPMGDETLDPAAEPTVTIIWSEHERFREGETMPLSKANTLMETLDEEMLEKPFYCKTKFRIDYVFDGETNKYEGRQDLGDGDGTLIDHIEQFHAAYVNNEKWNDWLLRHGGAEELEEDQEQRRWLINEFVPYLKMHCNFSKIEQIARENLAKDDISSVEAAYYKAVQEHVTKCRQMINSGDYDLPPEPRLADFDPKLQAYEEIEAYKEHVENEIAQEAAAAGMTVEEYAANGYEPWDTFSIYQLKDDAPVDYHFRSMEDLQKKGLVVTAANYEKVYDGILQPDMSLEDIYEKFNIDRPEDFKGHSLSVSDVVVLHQKGADTAHYVDSIGFADTTKDFLKENTSRTAEQSVAQSENTQELTAKGTKATYYAINEEAARRAKEANSYDDYVPGSATAEYRRVVEEAAEIAEKQKKRVDPMYHEKIDGLLDAYARKTAENMNARYEIDARVPSFLITGGGNFPVSRKEKQNAAREKNWKEWQEIQGLLDKIRSTGMGGISADDPQAIHKLEDKLKSMQEWQDTMKAVNSYYRTHKTLDGCPGLSDEKIKELKAEMASQWHVEDKPYASWELSNNNAEIRRVKERIAELTQRRETPYVGWQFDGGRVEANEEDNRLQIFFDEKPDENMRNELKGSGFRWSPKAGAWQRQLNNNAFYAADRIQCIQPLSGECPTELQKQANKENKAEKTPEERGTGDNLPRPRKRGR